MSLCSQVIGKIVEAHPGYYKAIAEHMEYRMYSSNPYIVGDCVLCYVFSYDEEEDREDEGEFYLEDANEGRSFLVEWEQQEKLI